MQALSYAKGKSKKRKFTGKYNSRNSAAVQASDTTMMGYGQMQAK
jgi:hypothetical protein